MIRRLKLLIALAGLCLCAACGDNTPDPVAKDESAFARIATGGRSCWGGLPYIVYSQPLVSTRTREAFGSPARINLTLTNDTTAGVASTTQARETMVCTETFYLWWNTCSYAPNTYCNSTAWAGCAIYRKNPGESTWHISRSGWVDVYWARTVENDPDHFLLNFTANWHANETEGTNGCGSTAVNNYYEFH